MTLRRLISLESDTLERLSGPVQKKSGLSLAYKALSRLPGPLGTGPKRPMDKPTLVNPQGVSSGRLGQTIGYLVTIQSNMGGDPLKVYRVSRRKSNHNIQNIQTCDIPNSCPTRKVLYRSTAVS
ncbi:hypothetical protein TNCV_545631 [Trichonephila clavipes]|nr:hypothetical protein TNCV_545631 [Trichonephila clavipes]